MPRNPSGVAPQRRLTDWTTTAGVDGSGLLALVTGGAAPEAIHLATLGYEAFVLHADQSSADAAEQATHVHHVVADPESLPAEWSDRFGLVVSMDGQVPGGVVAPQGLVVTFSSGDLDLPGLTHVAAEALDDGEQRSVWIKLDA